jgi:c(7)-type cytochrome triheme protein
MFGSQKQEAFMKLRWFIALTLLLVTPAVLSARWIEDMVVMQVEATGKVEFSHYNHLEALGKNCPTCHNAIFNIVPEKNPAFTMAEMEKGKSCGACHNGTKAFGVKEKANCSNCHPTRDITFETDAGPALFSHEVHTGMFGCSDCHPAVFIPQQGKNPKASMADMEGGASCGACHDGSGAFTVKENCETCHKM